MEGRKIRLVLMCMVVYVCRIVPSVRGNIGEFDEYWKQRSKEAKRAAQKAYKPDPLNVTAHFNHRVHIAVKELNSTRRELGDKRKKYSGPCMAVNPIDKCWRCDPKWEANRKRLADCVVGFARGTTGGKAGRIYVVTDPSDGDMLNPKPGTLRHAVIQPEPLWIIFARSMNIRLTQELLMTSDKTIDGRGAHVHVSHGAQISLQFVRNIIIHGLHIHDIKKGSGGMIRDSVNHFGIRTQSDGDGISMFGVSNVWIDHISLANCEDGLIDAIMGSTAITISNCHMTSHNDVMLFGASDWYSKDAVMQVTIAFNHFGQGLVQRMPRCRWGYFHVVNNDYTHWLMYAIGGSTHPTIISQGNRFIAPPNINCKEVTKRDYAPESVWRSWNWRSEGDLFMNGAFFRESGIPVPNKFKDQFAAQPGTMANALTRFSGALGCIPGKPC